VTLTPSCRKNDKRETILFHHQLSQVPTKPQNILFFSTNKKNFILEKSTSSASVVHVHLSIFPMKNCSSCRDAVTKIKLIEHPSALHWRKNRLFSPFAKITSSETFMLETKSCYFCVTVLHLVTLHPNIKVCLASNITPRNRSNQISNRMYISPGNKGLKH